MKDVIALSEKKTRKPRTSAEVKRYGHAEGTDRSANFNVVEYAVRDMFKGKSISAAVTRFYVYRSEDKNDAGKWLKVEGYGKTPGERKTDAIRRSGLV